jgi:hypothetical protein
LSALFKIEQPSSVFLLFARIARARPMPDG